jgi:hypothetical protein
MSQIVQFRRPEAAEGTSSVFVECNGSPEPHVRHMESLGYVVVNEATRGAGRPPMRSELTR